MDKSILLVDYVGLKMAQSTPELMKKRRQIGREQFRAVIADCQATVVGEKLETIAQTFRKRFGFKVHPCLFRRPTIAQWCRDIAGKYTASDVLEILSQETGLSVAYLSQSRIGDGAIMWPYLFDLVSEIENVTEEKSVILEDYSGFTIPEDASFKDLAKALANA